MSPQLDSFAGPVSIIFPLVFGAIFAVVGLNKKYPTEIKYVYRLFSAWLYILFSSIGSLGFNFIMQIIGIKLIANSFANSILLGVIGPGVFLKVLSKFPAPVLSSNDVENQLTTLRDYIDEVLDRSISRKTIQIVEMRIREAGRYFDPDRLLRDVDSILGSISGLSDEEKRELELQFDKNIMYKDYAPIIRELKKYYDVDHIIRWLTPEDSSMQIHHYLSKLVQVSLESQGLKKTNKPILTEFVIAKIQALQKNPKSCLYYLELALKKMPSLKRDLFISESDWWILISMTCGEKQREELEALMSLVGSELLSIEKLGDKFIQQNIDSISLIAVKKDNGNCVKIIIKQAQKKFDHPSKWWIICEGNKHLDRECATLDEVMSHIEDTVILVRFV